MKYFSSYDNIFKNYNKKIEFKKFYHKPILKLFKYVDLMSYFFIYKILNKLLFKNVTKGNKFLYVVAKTFNSFNLFLIYLFVPIYYYNIKHKIRPEQVIARNIISYKIRIETFKMSYILLRHSYKDFVILDRD